MTILGMLESCGRNIRYAGRTLARSPLFALAIVTTLAIGIGANAAIFSAIDAVLLRPLSLPDPDRLVYLDQEGTLLAPIRLEDWNRENATFEAITGYSFEDASDTTGEIPERILRASVAPRFLAVWGVAPLLGRGFTEADHRGPSSVTLISERYWRRRFDADPDVLGATIRISGESLSVVGVLPASFDFPEEEVDAWRAASLDGAYEQWREATSYRGIGRLKPGVTIAEARTDLERVQAGLAEDFPDTDRGVSIAIEPLKSRIVAGAGWSLWLLFGAVCMLLLIACTNIAALLLARASEREREIAIRHSLGASRRTVALQLLVETGTLAGMGAGAGLLVAVGMTKVLTSFVPDMPRGDEIGIDGRVVLYTMGLAVLVTLLCGLLPAIRSTDGPRLVSSARGQVSGRNRVQWLLVGAQVTLSVTLLIGAGLLLRSFDSLSRVERGFDASRVLAFRMTADYDETRDWAAVYLRIHATIDALENLPGIASAATTHTPPGIPRDSDSPRPFRIGTDGAEPEVMATGTIVSPAYFATVGIPVLAGNLCSRTQNGAARRQGAEVEAMVDRSFADRYLAGRAAVGTRLSSEAWGMPNGRIVGVVENARQHGIHRPPMPTVYLCITAGSPFVTFLARTAGEPLAMLQPIRQMLSEVEPGRSMYEVTTLEAGIGQAFSQDRLRTILLTSFAGVALSLACLGIFATLSYTVQVRRREIGLRMALGARSGDILARYLRKTLTVVGIAALAGTLLALALGRTLSAVLYGVSATDPVTLLTAVCILVTVAMGAAFLPAKRASSIEPMSALQEQ